MRNHDECDEAIAQAQARGKHSFALFLAARCDLHHGPQIADEHLAETGASEEGR